MRFKEPGLKKEFNRAGWLNPRLIAALLYLDLWAKWEYSKNLIITCLSRTDEDQIEIYPEYYRKHGEAKRSYHNPELDGADGVVCAADVRIWGWTDEMQTAIQHEFITHFKYEDIDKLLIERDHLHIQMGVADNDDPIYVGSVE